MIKTREPTGARRNKMLCIKVNDAERQALKELAAAVGVSVGAYLLGLALGDQIARNITDKPDPDQMKLEQV